MDTSPFLDHLLTASNAHDLEGIVACFAEDYRLEAPCHPSRDFTGRDQVRRNWTTILSAVPDHRAEVVDQATHGDSVWSEWVMTGTRRDGSPQVMRGVFVFTVRDGLARSARMFMEPVEQGESTMDRAVEDLVRGPSATGAGPS